MSLKTLAITASLGALGLANSFPSPYTKNTTYYNPIIPGFHPDPSCIFVKEWDNTFFCASSSFIAFPGMPIHASKDLVNWKLVSHVQSRPSQFPGAGNITRAGGGWYAPTIRYHQGTFYVINVDVDAATGGSGIFTTKNPYDNDAWSDLLEVEIGGYDPDLFFDKSGTIYSQAAITILGDPFTTDIEQFTIDLPSGNSTPRHFLTNGTGVQPPEGPHMYYKDGYYWLLLAQGGTALDHQVTISRSKSPSGPWELDPSNPILTAINTTSLFQTVGHADLFQDATGEWPILQPVRGKMSGPLPPRNVNIPGTGPFVKDPDHYTFPPGSSLPRHFTYWRFPKAQNYVVSPAGHSNTLRLIPSNSNLTEFDTFDPRAGKTFIGRRQTDTLFTYTIDMSFTPQHSGEEAGATIYLRQERHAEIGVVNLNGTTHLRFRAEGPDAPATVKKPIPNSWCEGISFEIKAFNFTHYSLSAGARGGHLETFAQVNNSLLSLEFTGKSTIPSRTHVKPIVRIC
ncbi:hypothetical protein LTR86_004852 [Recurvomyces mirabilis]|nr:hypothetical protein LTR86_004852 [Recurvomyces mirabilis]